jgi:hypothetical protein
LESAAALRSTPGVRGAYDDWLGAGLDVRGQLGHSRVSMVEEVYLGRQSQESRVAAAWEGVDPMAAGKGVGIYGPGDGREAAFALVRELARES